MSEQTNKKRTSFYISEETILLLKKLAEKDDRSQAYMIEKLVKEAAQKQKVKL